ncbi:MAG TPA: twin-arginine translocation signal domain-containing protein [Verrucomicrobiae bacterium]|nr:twin-arginine translocation signal domain-containing protein [Verrucomicrobiae bacterium]
MHTNDYLFPARLNRRDFLQMTTAAAATLALPALAHEKPAPVKMGSGHHTYEVVQDWGQLPPGMKYGLGCGIVVDSKDRVYVTSRSTNPAVAVFDRHGKLLETWGNEFAEKVGYQPNQVADTAHCLYWSKEGGQEYFYFTENVSTNKDGPKLGKRVYKTDLKGKILFEIGNVAKEGTTAQKFEWTNPTDVAVAANGDIYVVDGYGSQRVTRFDKNFKPIKTIGSRGKEHGQFNTCHGVWINTLRKGEPEVYIADRANSRIEVYSMELDYKRTVEGNLRNPCCFYQHKDKLYVPDLAARVTIFDAHDQLVTHLGDGKEADGKTAKPGNDQNPAMFAAPHAMCVDSHGDLYVLEWVPFGRPRKFKHTPAA